VIKRICLICVAINLFALTACQTTTDPSKGGLFSYDPEAYEKRIENRENRLKEIEDQQEIEKQKSEQLQHDLTEKKVEKNEFHARIAVLEDNLVQLKSEIKNVDIETEKREKEILHIELESKALEEELNKIKMSSTEGIESKKKEIERLELRIDELLKEAEVLSHM
jgi:chromosome segregation ATPase